MPFVHARGEIDANFLNRRDTPHHPNLLVLQSFQLPGGFYATSLASNLALHRAPRLAARRRALPPAPALAAAVQPGKATQGQLLLAIAFSRRHSFHRQHIANRAAHDTADPSATFPSFSTSYSVVRHVANDEILQPVEPCALDTGT
jgi:hypothetical protein